MANLPYAEECNYWKSGTSSPDTWIERTKKLIIGIGGKVQGEAFGKDGSGRAAYVINEFMLTPNIFVSPPRNPRNSTITIPISMAYESK